MKCYDPGRVGSLYLGFAVSVTGGHFGLIYERFSSQVKACGRKARLIGVDVGVIEDVFGFIGVSLGMETFGAVSGDEASVARQMSCSWVEGILRRGRGTGLWCCA